MGSRGLLRPVGPLPMGVYWRRRVVVAVIGLVVLLLGKAALGGGSSRHPVADRSTTGSRHAQTTSRTHAERAGVGAAASPAASAARTASAGSPTRARTHVSAAGHAGHPIGAAAKEGGQPATLAPHASAAVAPAVAPACVARDVTLSTTSDATSYTTSDQPRFLLTVANTSQRACRVDLGTAVRSVVVRSGNDRIWSSADCITGDHKVVTLRAGERVAYAFTWSLRRSSPGCPATTADALPGTYRVSGQLGGLSSPEVVFVIHG